jgi:GR25 family glycosyltransferase involved in LPS biosynthesis
VSVQFFCLHHPDLRGRKRRMLKQFARQSMDVEWIEGFHPRDSAAWDVGPTECSTLELSVALKHREAFRRQVSRAAEVAVVLEDDVELPDGFPALLEGWLAEFDSLHGDLLMIGTCFDIHAPETTPGRSVYCGPGFRTRCAHAYAVTLKTSEAILPMLDEIPEAIDHYLNRVVADLGLRICYVEPGVEQLTNRRELVSAIQLRRRRTYRLQVLKRRTKREVRFLAAAARRFARRFRGA